MYGCFIVALQIFYLKTYSSWYLNLNIKDKSYEIIIQFVPHNIKRGVFFQVFCCLEFSVLSLALHYHSRTLLQQNTDCVPAFVLATSMF